MPRVIRFLNDQDVVKNKINKGAIWILLILGISLFHTLISLTNYNEYFIRSYGFGVIYVFDSLNRNGLQMGYSETNIYTFMIVSLLIYIFIAGLWYLTVKKLYKMALSSAIIFTFMDSMLFLLFGQIIPILIHAIAIYYMYYGYKAFKDVEIKHN